MDAAALDQPSDFDFVSEYTSYLLGVRHSLSILDRQMQDMNRLSSKIGFALGGNVEGRISKKISGEPKGVEDNGFPDSFPT
jgi:hypothetical protein